jgi:putative transposase
MKFVEKLRYIHRNPVKRGLASRPEDWPWSSSRHYGTGETRVVGIESQWTAARRERAGTFLTLRVPPPAETSAQCPERGEYGCFFSLWLSNR